MRYSRRKQLFIITILFSAIACLSIGFAAFSTTLNISSSASVTADASQFIVKFSTSAGSLDTSPVTPSNNSYGLATTNGIINNSTNPMVSNLSATFTFPGQYVEYTLYARNEGEYNSYLNSVNFIGDKTCEAVGDASVSLVNSACDSINVVVYVDGEEYRETTEISNHVLEKKTGEQIIIRLEYATDGTAVDGDFRILFPDIMLVYSTINDSSYMPDSIGFSNISETLYSKVASDPYFRGTDLDTNYGAQWDGKSGVFIRNGTENHVNPIYYYRGEVDNNNVLFANKCWKMVRTTETGGVKIIYNGDISDNKCYGDNPTIGRSAFNVNWDETDDSSYVYSDGTNSTIKQAIDTWFASYIDIYIDELEDTVWCNDRSVSFSGDHDSLGSNVTLFGPYFRNAEIYQPSLHCPAEYALTVSATNVSNKLTFPVGLLTSDEVTLAGGGYYNFVRNGYLNIFDSWWTMSPNYFYHGIASNAYVFVDGDLNGDPIDDNFSVRPVISLKPGTIVSSGNGSKDFPYVIE